MAVEEFFTNHRWRVVDIQTTEPRAAELFGVDDLPLAAASRNFLARLYPRGIYRHQKEALKRVLAGEDVCLVTGTSSGKSLVFQTAAVNLLAHDPNARVMAIYPMKALGNEQRDRWQIALESAGMASPLPAPAGPAAAGRRSAASMVGVEGPVGRIDGNVPPGFRLNILERSRVVVFTPDIIHAWLFSNLNQPVVIDFLRRVRLVVVDEVHAYTGVFGSNAAFLLRRLQHLISLLGTKPAYIAASATIAHPEQHLRNLFGRSFTFIGPDLDTSPRYPLQVNLVDPSGRERFLDEVVRLLEFLAHQEKSRFIAFVDSRKQVELISSILNRLLKDSKEEPPVAEDGTRAPARSRAARGKKAEQEVLESDELDPESEVTGVLQSLNVVPYRAGYEDHDRRQIQERLTEGTLNGVVSTSALELGIDVPNLDICVLIGVPSSATSLQQRIGRIGRHGPGMVIAINGGDVHDEAVFAHPRSFFHRPLAESTLYLENEHIQYIHALCLARSSGEHDQVEAAAHEGPRRRKDLAAAEFSSAVNWPEHFIDLCRRERAGNAPRQLASLKLEAHDRPNYTFPLRDVESQFKIERREGPNVTAMGSMSFGQLMREAYPGAIYYYATIPYRVTRVNVKSKVVQVRREKRYTTQPQRTSPAIFPRLSPEGIFSIGRQGSLLALETQLLVRESISGVTEQRGRNESLYPYPLSREMGFSQDQPFFSRNYFTTGVVLTSPVLAGEGINLDGIAAILYEAFMLMIPFERQDIGFTADRFRANKAATFAVDAPFLAIYDRTYGSLRLSARLLQPGALARVLSEAAFLAHSQESLSTSPGSLRALAKMALAAVCEPREELAFAAEAAAAPRDPERWERVVLPDSKGLMVRTNEEFYVLRILNTPVGLSYEGTPTSMLGTSASVMPLLADVAEIPGESEAGWYNLETGEIEPVGSLEGATLRASGLAQESPPPDPAWLRGVLATYHPEEALQRLALQMEKKDLPGGKEEQAAVLVQSCNPAKLLEAALRMLLEDIN